MLESIPWRDIIITLALIVAGVVLIVDRMKPETRRSIAERLRPSNYFGTRAAHPQPQQQAHGAHDHHEDDHDGHGGSDKRPVFAAILIAAGIVIILVSFFVSGESPSPGSLAEAIRERWLMFALAILLLYIGAGFADNRWGLKKIAHAITAFIVVIGLFGTAIDNVGKEEELRQKSRTARLEPKRLDREPNPSWIPIVIPHDRVVWDVTPIGYSTAIRDPGLSPDIRVKDPTYRRYKRWCRNGGEVHAFESGMCIVAEEVGYQSIVGFPITIVRKDIPNSEIAAVVPVPQPPPLPKEETVGEEPIEAEAGDWGNPTPEPASEAYGQPLESYRHAPS